jgi:hypothetical protein
VSEALSSWAARVGRRVADDWHRRGEPGRNPDEAIEAEIRLSPLLRKYAEAARRGFRDRLAELLGGADGRP